MAEKLCDKFLLHINQLTKWQMRVFTIIRIKRSKTVTIYYRNSTSTFRPILQLLPDIELNPAPDNFSMNDSRATKNKVKLAHLNARSLKCREHYVLVKETIFANKFDVFTTSETWFNDSVTDVDVEVPGYKLYRVDRQNKKDGGICVYVLLHQLWIKIQIGNLKSD